MRNVLRELPENFRNALRVARLRPFDTSSAEGRSLERYRRIALGTTASLVGRAVTTAAGLLVVPITLSSLGKDGYGLWVTASALGAWVGLLDPGLSAGLLNGIAESEGRDDRQRARVLFSTAFFSLAFVSLLGLAIGGLLLPHLSWESVVSIPRSIGRTEVAWTVAATLGLTVAALPFGTVTQVFAGTQRAYVATALSTVGTAFSFGALLLAVVLGGSLPAISAALTSGALVAGIASLAVLVRRVMPGMRPRLSDVSRAGYRRLLASAAPLYLFQIGSLLVNQSQSLVLARRAGLGTVTAYDILWRFVILGVGLVTLSTSSAFPTFREAWERGDHAWMRRAFWHVVRLRLALTVGGCTVLLLVGNWIIRVWLGRNDFQYPAIDWLLLSSVIAIAVWTSSFLEVLTVLDRVWRQIPAVIAQGALTATLTWILVPHFGLRGAILGSIIPALLVSVWYFPLLAWPMLVPGSDNRPS